MVQHFVVKDEFNYIFTLEYCNFLRYQRLYASQFSFLNETDSNCYRCVWNHIKSYLIFLFKEMILKLNIFYSW